MRNLAVGNDFPLEEVARHVRLAAFVDLVGVLSSFGRLRPVLGRSEVPYFLRKYDLVRHMDIRIVFLVINENMIIQNNGLTFLSIIVTR